MNRTRSTTGRHTQQSRRIRSGKRNYRMARRSARCKRMIDNRPDILRYFLGALTESPDRKRCEALAEGVARRFNMQQPMAAGVLIRVAFGQGYLTYRGGRYGLSRRGQAFLVADEQPVRA